MNTFQVRTSQARKEAAGWHARGVRNISDMSLQQDGNKVWNYSKEKGQRMVYHREKKKSQEKGKRERIICTEEELNGKQLRPCGAGSIHGEVNLRWGGGGGEKKITL